MKYNPEHDNYTHSTLEEGYDFIITNKFNESFHFKIATFPVSSGQLSEAVQVVNEKGYEPYKFYVLSDFDADTEHSESLLKDRIKRGVNHKSIDTSKDGFSLNTYRKIYGRIDSTDDQSDTNFENVFVIDGKRITMESFIEMLQPLESFNFKFEIVDPSDDYML